MKQVVTAVVIAHDQPHHLESVLAALSKQTRKADQVLLVDTSTTDECTAVAQAAGVTQIIRLSPKLNLARIMAAARAEIADSGWLWIIHDDSAPLEDALELLLQATEISPSVAIAGPKQVEWANNRVVMQQGLTLTPMGGLFSLVRGELDQGQHDDTDDVMAVGTAGALIRLDAFDTLNGFDHRAPTLAADFDFSIRARLAGFRVVVVPAAKIAHAGLTLAGGRPRKWLKTSPKAALRRAAIHLRLVYSPLPLALLFWLALPLVGLARAIWRIISKRPDKIWSEISAALWGFFSLPRRLTSRSGKPRVIPFSKLRGLRADWSAVRASARSQLDAEQTQTALAAFSRGEPEGFDVKPAIGFVAAGGLWVSAFLVAVSWAFWPAGVALIGAGSMPLNESWVDLFARAGSSYQPIGFGFFGPSDPFVWALTVIGGLTFWAPSLAIALVFLLAKAVAFAGAWRVAGLVAENAVVKILAALTFALWPALNQALGEARVASVLAIVALPWLVLALARVANLGKVSKSAQQTWSWVAVAGLLMAIVGASAPSSLPILALGFIALVAARIRRIGYLIWVPLPLAVLYGPTVLWQIQNQTLLSLLADPGVPQGTQAIPNWQLLLGGFNYGFDFGSVGQIGIWLAVPALILALVANLSSRVGLSLGLWVYGLLAVACAWFVSQVLFVAVSSGVNQAVAQTVAGSPAVLLSVFALTVALLVAIALEHLSSKFGRRLAAGALVAALLPAMVFAAASQPKIHFTDGRVVPSIVAAEAAGQSDLKVLVINPTSAADGSLGYSAELITGQGVHLEDLSLNYRFALHQQSGQAVDQLTNLVGALVAANNSDLQKTLSDVGIGYILVPSSAGSARADLAINLNSVKELEAVGETDFGGLWRVPGAKTSADSAAVDNSIATADFWSITKGIQACVLAAFILLALPTTPGRRRKGAAASSIFVEAGEEN